MPILYLMAALAALTFVVLLLIPVRRFRAAFAASNAALAVLWINLVRATQP